MENTLATILIVAFLLIGAVGGVVLTPEEECPVVDTIVEYQNISVPGEIEYISLPSQLDLAVAEFLIAVEDEEDEAGNNVDVLGRYDFDEMELNRIYDAYKVSYDDGITTVDFKIRLRFDEDDARAVKKTYEVTVIFDTEEDTIVNSTLI